MFGAASDCATRFSIIARVFASTFASAPASPGIPHPDATFPTQAVETAAPIMRVATASHPLSFVPHFPAFPHAPSKLPADNTAPAALAKTNAPSVSVCAQPARPAKVVRFIRDCILYL